MSFLTVINESGVPPHSTCLFEWGDAHPKRLKWYGYFPTNVSLLPSVHKLPLVRDLPLVPYLARHVEDLAVKGRVETEDRTQYITSYVRFEVLDSSLRLSEIMMDTDWRGCTYVIGVRDCVSMAAAVAKKCGLYVPFMNMTPTGLVEFLNLYNTTTHYQPVVSSPYPWVAPPPSLTPEQLDAQRKRDLRWEMRQQEQWA